MSDVALSMITHRRILGVAIPIILANTTVPLLGLVDTGVIGQLGTAAPIVAVGLGATILTFVYWMFGFLRMATVGLVAQANGAGNQDEVVVLFVRAVGIALMAGASLILLQSPIFSGGLWISASSPEAEAMADSYMSIRIWSAPAAISVYAITGWLVALERTRAVFVVQVAMNGLNVVLDLLFVLGFDWGVEGVALATFIAEWTGAGIGLWLCRGVFVNPVWRQWSVVIERASLMAFARLGRDITIRSFLLKFIFVSFVLVGTSFGDVPLAANHILLQFLLVTSHAMDGIAFAAEALVGRAFGAHNIAALRKSVRLAFLWGLVIGLVLALAFAVFGGVIIDVMTTAPEVRTEARVYLIFMVLTPICGVGAWMFDGIFIGAMRARDMRNMMVLSAVIYTITCAALVPTLGNTGLWIALLVSFVVRGLSLWAKYPGLLRAATGPLQKG